MAPLSVWCGLETCFIRAIILFWGEIKEFAFGVMSAFLSISSYYSRALFPNWASGVLALLKESSHTRQQYVSSK